MILYDWGSERLSLDRTRSSLYPSAHRDRCEAPLRAGPDGLVQLRVFLDHSVLEVWGGGACWLTSRIYPARSDSMGIKVASQAGVVQLDQLDFWRLEGIWS
jgi:beta-fructofuranosidase